MDLCGSISIMARTRESGAIRSWRSLITLKALTYRPYGRHRRRADHVPARAAGGSLATGTTASAGSATRPSPSTALLMAGYVEEAEAWREWLLRAVAGDPPLTCGSSTVSRASDGARSPFLPWLPGYDDSAPVRVGNDASAQFQLDVYGEVLDLLHQAAREGLPHESAAWDIETRMLDALESPLARARRRHLGGARRSAAVRPLEGDGLGRGSIARSGTWRCSDSRGQWDRWRALRAEMHDEICLEGFDDSLGSLQRRPTATRSLDASALMMPLVGFLPIEGRPGGGNDRGDPTAP